MAKFLPIWSHWERDRDWQENQKSEMEWSWWNPILNVALVPDFSDFCAIDSLRLNFWRDDDLTGSPWAPQNSWLSDFCVMIIWTFVFACQLRALPCKFFTFTYVCPISNKHYNFSTPGCFCFNDVLFIFLQFNHKWILRVSKICANGTQTWSRKNKSCKRTSSHAKIEPWFSMSEMTTVLIPWPL